jgi:hypothetical protein
MVKRANLLQSPNPIKHQCEEPSSFCPSPSQNAESQRSVVQHARDSSPDARVRSRSNVSGDVSSASDVTDISSPLVSPLPSVPPSPSSPGSNRAAFMSRHVPSRVMCNMDLCRSPPGSKVALSAIVIAVFDASTNPDRRYVQVADASGSVGITVWNTNVGKLTRASIGRVIKLGKVVIGSHQGKKVLTMTRESTLEFDDDHPLLQWWKQLAHEAPVSLANVIEVADNSIINLAGIVGMIVAEQKLVGTKMKDLITMHLVDPTGQLDLRTWNHSPHHFDTYTELPVLFRRVRVTSFAGMKIGELLDNDGTVMDTEFKGSEILKKYWAD